MSTKLSKTKKKQIFSKMKSDNQLLPAVLQDLGITDPVPQVRKQLIEEFGQEAFSEAIQGIRATSVPTIKKSIERMLENKGDKLTEEFCDKLIDELTDSLEVVYIKKDDLNG